MGILSWIIFGLIAGVLAKLFMPGKDPGGFIVTILIGIAGAIVGGLTAIFSGSVPSLASIFAVSLWQSSEPCCYC